MSKYNCFVLDIWIVLRFHCVHGFWSIPHGFNIVETYSTSVDVAIAQEQLSPSGSLYTILPSLTTCSLPASSLILGLARAGKARESGRKRPLVSINAICGGSFELITSMRTLAFPLLRDGEPWSDKLL